MSKQKKDTIEVKGFSIQIYTEDFKNDYISLTDIARYKNTDVPRFVIQNRMRNRNTLEFIGLWEVLNNSDFNRVQFDTFRNEASLNELLVLANMESYNAILIKKVWSKKRELFYINKNLNKLEFIRRRVYQMNLLEYIRKRNKITKQEWEDGFEKGEVEILVLIQRTGGASKRNGFWEGSVYFLAYVDCKTDMLYKDEGRLVYPVSDEEYEKDGIIDCFKNETIYRLKVREKKQEDIPEGITKSSQNQLFVVEILEENVSCPELEEILTEYNKPIILEDEILGKLTLNKEFSWFEGSVSWQGKMIEISLEVNKDNKSSWTKARKAMKNMLSEQENQDREMRTFAAKQLTTLACDWRDSADEPVPEITEQSFSKRITLNSISMTSGGSFSAYFDDDDMFFGHCITVRGSLKKGIVSADMEG